MIESHDINIYTFQKNPSGYQDMGQDNLKKNEAKKLWNSNVIFLINQKAESNPDRLHFDISGIIISADDFPDFIYNYLHPLCTSIMIKLQY